MMRRVWNVVRARPKTAVLLVVMLVASTTVVGVYVRALQRWRAAQDAVGEGRAAEAWGQLEFCLRVWPRSVPVHLLAARAARLSGDYEGAEAHLTRCLKLQQGASQATQLEFLL